MLKFRTRVKKQHIETRFFANIYVQSYAKNKNLAYENKDLSQYICLKLSQGQKVGI